MLSDERKKEIVQEEIFRTEIQEDLKKKEKKSKTWEFLNSSFGIWLLSSVALGLITWGYTQISQSIAADKKNATEIEKHNIEIAARVSNYKVAVSHLRQNGDYYNSNDIILFFAQTTLPEFRDKNLRALLLEQFVMVSGDRKSEVRKAIDGIDKFSQTKLEQIIGEGREEWQAPISDTLKQNAQKLVQIISESFDSPQWK